MLIADPELIGQPDLENVVVQYELGGLVDGLHLEHLDQSLEIRRAMQISGEDPGRELLQLLDRLVREAGTRQPPAQEFLAGIGLSLPGAPGGRRRLERRAGISRRQIGDSEALAGQGQLHVVSETYVFEGRADLDQLVVLHQPVNRAQQSILLYRIGKEDAVIQLKIFFESVLARSALQDYVRNRVGRQCIYPFDELFEVVRRPRVEFDALLADPGIMAKHRLLVLAGWDRDQDVDVREGIAEPFRAR